MHLICSRETRARVSPFFPLLPPAHFESRTVLCARESLSRVTFIRFRIFRDDERIDVAVEKLPARGANCVYAFLTKRRTCFYRFRRRFPARILRPYQQSNRRARQGRHFHVSGETSRRLQSKLYEKRERARP